MLAALEADPSEWAAKELATLRTKSPQACKVSLRLLVEGRSMASFADEMRQEYAVAARVAVRHDFREGVRALPIEQDIAPRLVPAMPENVTVAIVVAIFAPMPAGEAWTPLG